MERERLSSVTTVLGRRWRESGMGKTNNLKYMMTRDRAQRITAAVTKSIVK